MYKKMAMALILAGSVAYADCPQFNATYHCTINGQDDGEAGLVSTSYTPDLSFYEFFEGQDFTQSAISDGIEHYANEDTRATTTCVSSNELDLHVTDTYTDEKGELKVTRVSDDELTITGISEDGTQQRVDCQKISAPSPAARHGRGVRLLNLFKR
jgi:hypothetical protein